MERWGGEGRWRSGKEREGGEVRRRGKVERWGGEGRWRGWEGKWRGGEEREGGEVGREEKRREKEQVNS